MLTGFHVGVSPGRILEFEVLVFEGGKEAREPGEKTHGASERVQTRSV